MSKKLKVYGVNTNLLGIQARTIAAVTSQEQFAKLIGTSLGYVRDYGAETGNLEELAVAFKDVGTVFIECPTCKQWYKSRVINS